ncbi:hypothetical protein STENM223S_08158 [Streptomyces tendae]
MGSAPPVTGCGLATRAAAALTEEGFRLPGVEAMEIHCDRANVRSAHIPAPARVPVAPRVEPDEPQTPAEAGQSMVWRRDGAWTTPHASGALTVAVAGGFLLVQRADLDLLRHAVSFRLKTV